MCSHILETVNKTHTTKIQTHQYKLNHCVWKYLRRRFPLIIWYFIFFSEDLKEQTPHRQIEELDSDGYMVPSMTTYKWCNYMTQHTIGEDFHINILNQHIFFQPI